MKVPLAVCAALPFVSRLALPDMPASDLQPQREELVLCSVAGLRIDHGGQHQRPGEGLSGEVFAQNNRGQRRADLAAGQTSGGSCSASCIGEPGVSRTCWTNTTGRAL